MSAWAVRASQCLSVLLSAGVLAACGSRPVPTVSGSSAVQPPPLVTPVDAGVDDGGSAADAAEKADGGFERLPAGNDPVWISGNAYLACAVTAAGEVLCWGRSNLGQLAPIAQGADLVPTPSRLPGIRGAKRVAVGGLHSCVLLEDGTVHCWGSNDKGQCGSTSNNKLARPEQVVGLPPAHDIFVTATASCAIAGTELYCWGDETSDGSNDGSPTPRVLLAGKGEIRAAELGEEGLGCAATASGLWCWGSGAKRGGPEFAEITRLAVGEFKSVMVGDAHICALRVEGRVQCWGNMQARGSRWDHESAIDQLLDFAIADVEGVQVLAGARLTTCIVRGTQVRCGRAGRKVKTNPERVPSNVRQFSLSETGCALLEDYSIWCWEPDPQLKNAPTGRIIPWPGRQAHSRSVP